MIKQNTVKMEFARAVQRPTPAVAKDNSVMPLVFANLILQDNNAFMIGTATNKQNIVRIKYANRKLVSMNKTVRKQTIANRAHVSRAVEVGLHSVLKELDALTILCVLNQIQLHLCLFIMEVAWTPMKFARLRHLILIHAQ